jgi:hypothetical protein
MLEMLRADAVADETTTFDASGMSGFTNGDGTLASTSELESESIVTGTTMLSLESTSGSSSAPGSSSPTWNDYSEMNNDEKVVMLKDSFPSLNHRDVDVALRKCNFDIGRATDVLLNQVFFDESLASSDTEGIFRTRGIDAFSEDSTYSPKRGRAKKNKKKFRSIDDQSERSASTPASPSAANKWQSANEDITFIASRVQMSPTYISSVYHKHSASRRRTIVTLIEDHLREEKHDYDVQIAAYASDLVGEFPSLSHDQCEALLRLTKSQTAPAHELAKVLAYSPNGTMYASDLVPQYVPLKLSDESPTKAKLLASPFSGDSRTLLAARSTAFENASRYHRLGKSDRLMGGATAYYSSLGRDAHIALASATASEADALVASQSSSMVVDLHGVTVREAVRIASMRAESWWGALGERRIPGGGRVTGDGLHIVTGVGRHSEGGRAKLGPAVSRALMKEGWKVEVGSGELIVRGRIM